MKNRKTYIDFDVGVDGLNGEGKSSDETGAPYRDEHDVYVWNLLHDLQAHRALPRQDVRVVIAGSTQHQCTLSATESCPTAMMCG